MTSTPAVSIRNLTYAFGRHRDYKAVDDLTLEIAPGAILGLLGPNGAGKTTTIRLLNTLLPLQEGEVEIFGHSVRRAPMAVRRMLGYVPQQLSIEAALTGRENVEWFARLFDIPRRERKARVAEVLDLVGLGDAAQKMASAYSGGMVRRLELAQALVNRPELLVLDEPTVGLDPVARDSVWERISAMRAEHGMTVILTTHYMEEADELCDRVALMDAGRLQAVGQPAALKAELDVVSLEDVFRHYTGAGLRDAQNGGGEFRSVRSTRSTARRLG